MHSITISARFLTNEERVEVKSRLVQDRSGLADEYDVKYFWSAVKDWKIYVHMLITIGTFSSLLDYATGMLSLFKASIPLSTLSLCSCRQLSKQWATPRPSLSS